MSIFVVVTSTNGAEVVKATEVTESPTALLFREAGGKRKTFAKQEVVAWQACQTPTEAIAFIADKGPSWLLPRVFLLRRILGLFSSPNLVQP